MKLINPSFEIWEQEPGLEGIYKQIERASRVCYKSESNIKEGSAKKMVDALIKSGHGAMLEHGTVYLYLDTYDLQVVYRYEGNPYSKVIYSEFAPGHISGTYIITNYRVLVENDWLDDLKYLCEPTEHHEKRITVKFTTDIGVTREANRHRTHSIAEQSTRYCNYASNKHDNEISICLPSEITEEDVLESYNFWKDNNPEDNIEQSAFNNLCLAINDGYKLNAIDTWVFANLACQWSYLRLVELGWKPQQARSVLPLDTKSELVHTAFVSDWQHFFFLRADDGTGPAHPNIKALAVPLKEEFIKRGLI